MPTRITFQLALLLRLLLAELPRCDLHDLLVSFHLLLRLHSALFMLLPSLLQRVFKRKDPFGDGRFEAGGELF